jgi:hypothetical protein
METEEPTLIDKWSEAHENLFRAMERFDREYKAKGCPLCDGYDNWKDIPKDLKPNYLCRHLLKAKARKFNKLTSEVIEELVFWFIIVNSSSWLYYKAKNEIKRSRS